MLHTIRAHSRHKANKRQTKNEKLETNSLCKVSVCLFFAFFMVSFYTTKFTSLRGGRSSLRQYCNFLHQEHRERETWCAFLDMKCLPIKCN